VNESVEAAAVTEAPAARAAFVRARNRDGTLRRLLALADGLAIAGALGGAMAFASAGTAAFGDFLWGLLTLPAWVVLFKSYGLYDRDVKRVSHSTVDDLPWIFHALIVGSLGLWFLYRVLPTHRLILREGLTFFVVAGTSIFLARAAARSLARVAIPPERVLFLGGGEMARLLIEKVQSHPEYGLWPIGYVEAGGAEPRDLSRKIQYLGDLRDLPAICARESIDRIVVAAPVVDEETLTELIRAAARLDVRISILPQLVGVLGPSVAVDDVEGVTILGMNPPVLNRSSRALKRLMDISIAVPALVLSVPLLALMALAVKTTSRGPVLFSQERIGRGGRRFRMHKFRTMVRDAEQLTEELKSQSMHPAWLLVEHDPRITRVGRLLRHTSLDELPQLWNVVKGDMSLVGPRPMPPDVDEKIAGWGRRRLDLTPGITGLWQVLGRTKIPFEEMVKLDYLYVTNWSLWQDIRLLIKTLPAVVRRRGAN